MKNFIQGLKWIFFYFNRRSILLPPSPAPLHERPQEEAGPSRPSKQPCVEQRWHGNFQRDTRALVIFLQVRCVEPRIRGVTVG